MVACLLALSLARQAATAKPLATFEFELYRNQIYLDGRLRDRPLKVLVDTGFARDVLDLGVANALHVLGGGNVHVDGLGPDAAAGKFVFGADVALASGGLKANMDAALPLDGLAKSIGHPVDAILGTPFLQQYVVDIDYAARRLRLYAPQSPPDETGAVEFSVQAALPIVPASLSVGGSEVRLSALIDTGDPIGATLSPDAAGRLSLPEGTRASYTSLLGTVPCRLVAADRLVVGGATIPQPTLTVPDAAPAGRGYALSLGGAYLSHFRVVLDWSRRRIAFRATRNTD